MPNLYIIAGRNGAGKTTASLTILPEMLNCKEFVNADNIAAGLSPFNPQNVAIEAGRIMLSRIDLLLQDGEDLAIETTLSTRSYIALIKKARGLGYKVMLVYFWLSSSQEAKDRVAFRVSNGGHHIPDDVIERRYLRGLKIYLIYTFKFVIIGLLWITGPLLQGLFVKVNSMNQKLFIITTFGIE